MSSKSVATSESLLDELQTTLAHGTVARRVETLRRVTDLFIDGAVDYSDEQIGLFDDVFQCLIEHIETSAKALLANRLAPIDTAPPLTIRALAFDDLIEVAAPVLSRSERLDDEALIETARNKSQAHLMAISTRRVLSGAVTDVLVLRGNDEVVQSTVNNPGAEFSERGFTRLVNRAEGDDNLATCLGLRPTIPRHLYLKLLAKASATVRAAARGRQPAAGRRGADRGAGGDAAGALGALGDHPRNRNRPRAGQIAVRGRPARRTSGDVVRRSRQVRRSQRRDRGAGQCAGIDRREHDGGDPRRRRGFPPSCSRRSIPGHWPALRSRRWLRRTCRLPQTTSPDVRRAGRPRRAI